MSAPRQSALGVFEQSPLKARDNFFEIATRLYAFDVQVSGFANEITWWDITVLPSFEQVVGASLNLSATLSALTAQQNLFDATGKYWMALNVSNSNILCFDWRGALTHTQVPPSNFVGPAIVGEFVYWVYTEGSPTEMKLGSHRCDGAGSVSEIIIKTADPGDFLSPLHLRANGQRSGLVLHYTDDSFPEFDVLANLSTGGSLGASSTSAANDQATNGIVSAGDGVIYGCSSTGLLHAYTPAMVRDATKDFSIGGTSQGSNRFAVVGENHDLCVAAQTGDLINRAGVVVDSGGPSNEAVIVGTDLGRPLVETLPDQNHSTASDPYNRTVNAVVGDTPTWSLDISPEGMDIDSETGVITWPVTSVGNHTVTVRATNAVDFHTRSYQLSVT